MKEKIYFVQIFLVISDIYNYTHHLLYLLFQKCTAYSFAQSECCYTCLLSL